MQGHCKAPPDAASGRKPASLNQGSALMCPLDLRRVCTACAVLSQVGSSEYLPS